MVPETGSRDKIQKLKGGSGNGYYSYATDPIGRSGIERQCAGRGYDREEGLDREAGVPRYPCLIRRGALGCLSLRHRPGRCRLGHSPARRPYRRRIRNLYASAGIARQDRDVRVCAGNGVYGGKKDEEEKDG